MNKKKTEKPQVHKKQLGFVMQTSSQLALKLLFKMLLLLKKLVIIFVLSFNTLYLFISNILLDALYA